MHNRTPESDRDRLGCKCIGEMSPEELTDLAAKLEKFVEHIAVRWTCTMDGTVKETADRTKDL